MKDRLFLFMFLILSVSLVSAIVSAQRRTDDDKPITGDFRITVKTTTAGQSTQSTTMIKGARERSETSMNAGMYSTNTVNITQCDMRRTIQINDRARKYLITPMDSDSPSMGNEGSNAGAPAATGARRGGVVTMTVNTIDTGERRDMFGFTARHLKRSTLMESSPDACNPSRMKIETDGWYINLAYGLTCPAHRPPHTGGPGSTNGGCRDRYVYKTSGPANLGYPLLETTTMYGADGTVMYATSKEVVDISRQSLDAALFDIPAGYTQATSQQEMYSTPSAAEIMEMARQNNPAAESPASASNSTAARVRVGVVEFNNKTKTSVSTDELRQQLIAALTANGIDAVALNAISPGEALTEAQAKNCAYILYTDIATLKTPSSGKKIGGLFGRATGVGSADAGKNEARFDFRLFAAGGSSPIAQSSSTSKEDTQEAAVSEAIQSEARAVGQALPRQ